MASTSKPDAPMTYAQYCDKARLSGTMVAAYATVTASYIINGRELVSCHKVATAAD
jgi:hypothetical protein